MLIELTLTPKGHLFIRENTEGWSVSEKLADSLIRKFSSSNAAGLFYLIQENQLESIPSSFFYFKKMIKDFITRICHFAEGQTDEIDTVLASVKPDDSFFTFTVMDAPIMSGAEYITTEFLSGLWQELGTFLKNESLKSGENWRLYIQKLNPAWANVGKLVFHLAENKSPKSPAEPFIFMITFIHRLSEQEKPKHLPFSSAIKLYEKDKSALLALLKPLHIVAKKSDFIAGIIDTPYLYSTVALSADTAFQFIKDIPHFEETGIIVRMPKNWQQRTPDKVKVTIRLNTRRIKGESIFDFSPEVCLNGEVLTPEEIQKILASEQHLVSIKNQWVDANPELIKELLKKWQTAKEESGGILSFREGMRLLAGASIENEKTVLPSLGHDYDAVEAVDNLKKMLGDLANPNQISLPKLPNDLENILRPYQMVGVKWLWQMLELNLGCCLADDMGLGKTLQILSLLSLYQKRGDTKKIPGLLVVPASLLKNWELESKKFTPNLKLAILHPMMATKEQLELFEKDPQEFTSQYDLIVTTYGMVLKLETLSNIVWSVLIVDEAQAIKNPTSKQSRAIRNLKSNKKIALTGTPVENNLMDLWSLFDFISPGLLGKAKSFKEYVSKNKGADGSAVYAPLRRLTKPYIMRRMKTDKSIIADLPDKTEVKVYCYLSKRQVVMYEKAVQQMQKEITGEGDVKRRGVIFKYLTVFKQICNHPAHYLGDDNYNFDDSGKLHRLHEITEEIISRQEKVLVFSQFKEMTGPLFDYMSEWFGRPGLIIHGETAIKKRQGIVSQFQDDRGPPYMVLSLKAAGTGLNLTAANHVVHFDRWWNPAVENQATDRAYRIGQHSNVVVHKFICKGTIEERIDNLIEQKKSMVDSLLSEGAEKLLTNMSNDELMKFIALDISAANHF